MGPYHHAKKQQQQKLHACTHTQSPPHAPKHTHRVPPPSPNTHTATTKHSSKNKTNQTIQNTDGGARYTMAQAGPKPVQLGLVLHCGIYTYNQDQTWIRSLTSWCLQVCHLSTLILTNLWLLVFKLSEWCQMTCSGITTITIYFINPSGKLKLSLNHTMKKIS